MHRAHFIDQDTSSVHLFSGTIGMWASCFFSLSSGGGACCADTQATLFGYSFQVPCGAGGDEHNVYWYFWSFVLWQLSLAIFCDSSERAAVAISWPLSQNREIAVHSPLSSPGHFNSVSVGAAKNPAASWVVHPTATLPGIAPRASTSLSFMLLTSPSAPGSCAHSHVRCCSVVHVYSRAPVFTLVACMLLRSLSQSAFSAAIGL